MEKQKNTKKRYHFTVWVNNDEREIVDKLIQQTGLPASQFFLTQVIDKKIKTQRRKSWPNSIEPYALAIAKFSGMLSLLALKTKDRDMQQSANWLQSSECIKWLNKLILLRVFEDFEFPQLKNSLVNIEENTRLLFWQLDSSVEFEGKSKLLENTNRLNKIASQLLLSFEKQYIENSTPKVFEQFWSAEMDIFQEIKKIKNELLKL